MKFFSGFSLQDEECFFEPYLKQDDFCVAGFSYGAIEAFRYAQRMLDAGERIDTLQLLSPAFFQVKDEKFKRLQLMAYRKNEDVYLQQFLNACFLPHERKTLQRSVTTIDELEELLHYEWDVEALKALAHSGVVIEVYLGEHDQIVDAKEAYDFFKTVATATLVKNANHFLLRA